MDADSDASSLLTISASLKRGLYRYKGERRHQATNGDYAWPCDDAATYFELLLHGVLEKTYPNGLAYEPYEGALDEVLSLAANDGQPRMLDLGSGTTASWSIAMAERYPHVECIGVDLVPSDLEYLPSNLSIEVYDLLDGVPYPDDYFSLIHCRMGGVGMASFFYNPTSDFLADVARCLRPGGVLLLEESENPRLAFRSSHPENPHLERVRARQASRTAEYDRCVSADVAARVSWGQRMAAAVRQTERFTAEGSVHTVEFGLPLGVREW